MRYKRLAAAVVALAFGASLLFGAPKAQAMDRNDPNYVLHEIQARGTLRVPVCKRRSETPSLKRPECLAAAE